jgi:carbamoylphosphate synthase small subunit
MPDRSLFITREYASELAQFFANIREYTCRLVAGVSPEAMQVQAMPSASPGKWHLGHTAWFFDTFLLAPAGRGIADAT